MAKKETGKNWIETYNFRHCRLCPRACGADRTAEGMGMCGVSGTLRAARAALHFWEEPCISGTRGSGAVFFSGCPLQCVFCQNEEISHALRGEEISVEHLAEIFLWLQGEGANNINLVTPTQYVPQIVRAVEIARRQNLILPVVYNTSGYETVETLQRLEGIVDVYLPDFKYMDAALARKYSRASDYPAVAMAALAEMVRQQPSAHFYQETEFERCSTMKLPGVLPCSHTEMGEGDLIHRGVIVRLLLLPGALEDAKRIVRYLHETYGSQIYISLMSQYTPLPHVKDIVPLNRRVTEKEYDDLVDYALELGVTCGFIQERGVAEESFIPSFDGLPQI